MHLAGWFVETQCVLHGDVPPQRDDSRSRDVTGKAMTRCWAERVRLVGESDGQLSGTRLVYVFYFETYVKSASW